MKKYIAIAMTGLMLAAGSAFAADPAPAAAPAAEVWLTSLITATPQEGFALAVTMSRRGVKTTQPNVEVLKKGRAEYASDADSLMMASQVIALNFQTVAAANNYWRK